jgi:hypothetical protein
MKKIALLVLMLLIDAGHLWAQQEKIELSPSSSYERYIIFETLAVFWIGIIGLIIIIKMKLKEIERIQKMGINKEEKDAPLLD